MATKAKAPAVKSRKVKTHTFVHRAFATLAMACFGVVIIGGVMAEASTIAITYRAFVVIFVIALVKRVLLRAWDSFEEMRRGQT